MLEIFIYTFIYLTGIILVCELVDLSWHINERPGERLFLMSVVLLWPITLTVIMICVIAAIIYNTLRWY